MASAPALQKVQLEVMEREIERKTKALSEVLDTWFERISRDPSERVKAQECRLMPILVKLGEKLQKLDDVSSRNCKTQQKDELRKKGEEASIAHEKEITLLKKQIEALDKLNDPRPWEDEDFAGLSKMECHRILQKELTLHEKYELALAAAKEAKEDFWIENERLARALDNCTSLRFQLEIQESVNRKLRRELHHLQEDKSKSAACTPNNEATGQKPLDAKDELEVVDKNNSLDVITCTEPVVQKIRRRNRKPIIADAEEMVFVVYSPTEEHQANKNNKASCGTSELGTKVVETTSSTLSAPSAAPKPRRKPRSSQAATKASCAQPQENSGKPELNRKVDARSKGVPEDVVLMTDHNNASETRRRKRGRKKNVA